MKKHTLHLKCSMITAICMTLCIVLPFAFHIFPNSGTIFLPMHIPVFLCGLCCGWSYGMLCGFAGPLLSSFLTGMPPITLLPTMMVELAIYGSLSGLLGHTLPIKNQFGKLYLSMLPAMLCGRIIAGLLRASLFANGDYSFKLWFSGYFITALPGICIQLLLIPTIYLALNRAKLLPNHFL